MTVIINGTDNAVGNPAIQGGTGGTSAGLYYPAANTVAITTSGVNAVTFSSTQAATFANAATATAFIPSGSTAPTNGVYLPASNIVAFSTNSAEAMRIDSSGNLLIGTTSTSGSTSNSKNLTGGVFKTISGATASTASSVAVTLFTLPSDNDVTFMVTAYLSATGEPAVYNAVSMAIKSGSVGRIVSLVTATNLTISISGLNVQATQTSGISAAISYSAIRLA